MSIEMMHEHLPGLFFGPKQEKGYFQKEWTKYVNQNVNKWKIQ